jgi:peroxiredoxin Q/BCP
MELNTNQEVIFVFGETEERKNLWDVLALYEKTLLYFYPKDNTSGCTLEARDFSQFLKNFQDVWVNVIGVSKDGVKSHKKFIQNYKLLIPLISDESLSLHKEFWVLGEKKLYGKSYIGTIRSTFLLDKKWNILKEWRNIQAKWHSENVLKELQK